MSFAPSALDSYLAAAAALLAAERMDDAVELLRESEASVEKTGYDNWNGGTDTWTIRLLVEPVEYARLGSRRETLEKQIDERLKPTLAQFSNDWFSVRIAPKVVPRPDWRSEGGGVPRTVRRDIIDALKVEPVCWSGRLDEVEFLHRIYDLRSMPSHDSRFPTAADDIWQHRVNNAADWPDTWVFDDARFNLIDGPSLAFLRFLCETVHPEVRSDRNEALTLLRLFNEHLLPTGWMLVEQETIAGRPRYIAEKRGAPERRAVARANTVADALDAAWMRKEIERLEAAIERDPALAIGTAKDLVETCCKTILKGRGREVSRKDDLPELTKRVAKELKLVPDDIPDRAKGAETIRLLPRNLAAQIQYLAELRGLYGSGHGRDGNHRGLEPRHARLAVSVAVTFIDFVSETYRKHEATK